MLQVRQVVRPPAADSLQRNVATRVTCLLLNLRALQIEDCMHSVFTHDVLPRQIGKLGNFRTGSLAAFRAFDQSPLL